MFTLMDSIRWSVCKTVGHDEDVDGNNVLYCRRCHADMDCHPEEWTGEFYYWVYHLSIWMNLKRDAFSRWNLRRKTKVNPDDEFPF